MAMQYIEGELRKLGENDLAEDIALKRKQFARRGHGKDIAMPKAETAPTARAATPKEQAPTEVKRFSDEAREALTKEGYVIYELNGQSIRTQREAGRKFWSTWHADSRYADFETQSSMHSEVAVKPDQLFIEGSNNKTLKQQEALIAKYSTDLGGKVQGVEAIMGDAADYVGLTFAHLDATGERLFGEKYDYNWARTKTPTVGGGVASVGSFDADGGLRVSSWFAAGRDGFLLAAPLVVPKA